MRNQIEAGDLVRPKYAKPTGLFEVASVWPEQQKAYVTVYQRAGRGGYAKGETFAISLDMLEVVQKGDSKVTGRVK